jgi:hemerythrin
MLSELAAEHKRLYTMIDNLSAVIDASANANVIRQALELIEDRLVLHFQVEEKFVEESSAEINSLMHEDHEKILRLVRLAKEKSTSTKEDLVAAISNVKKCLKNHDKEFDWPVFSFIDRNCIA